MIKRDKLILQTKTLNDCRVVSFAELNSENFITLEFNARVRTNKTLIQKDLTKRQIAIHKLISYLKYEKGMSWRRISSWLNRSGIKTHTGKTWSKTGSSVHSVIKRMREREERIKSVRNKSFNTEISDFKIKYKGEKYEGSNL